MAHCDRHDGFGNESVRQAAAQSTVPKGVQNAAALHLDCTASTIAIREFLPEQREGMKRLVDVANKVNDPRKDVGLHLSFKHSDRLELLEFGQHIRCGWRHCWRAVHSEGDVDK